EVTEIAMPAEAYGCALDSEILPSMPSEIPGVVALAKMMPQTTPTTAPTITTGSRILTAVSNGRLRVRSWLACCVGSGTVTSSTGLIPADLLAQSSAQTTDRSGY